MELVEPQSSIDIVIFKDLRYFFQIVFILSIDINILIDYIIPFL